MRPLSIRDRYHIFNLPFTIVQCNIKFYNVHCSPNILANLIVEFNLTRSHIEFRSEVFFSKMSTDCFIASTLSLSHDAIAQFTPECHGSCIFYENHCWAIVWWLIIGMGEKLQSINEPSKTWQNKLQFWFLGLSHHRFAISKKGYC